MVREATPHYLGHRQRLRDRLISNPRELADYELLELLLTYALPRKDTKPMAKELLARFGSLGNALLTDPSRIMDIPGLGQGAATFWRVMQECLVRKAGSPVVNKEKFSTPDQVRDMVCSRLGHLTKEEFWIILVDNQNRLILFEQIFRGTVDQTAAYPREILELTLRHHASGLILVHNHPGGDANPSLQDRKLTEAISRLATDIGLRLLDHLVVTGEHYSSFRALGLL
ncbi:MAG: DNA repair protein RadC [Desulfovibrionales bacterium]|nr:DNA repair protein RadC [Desulfovibrionales bacterium]